FFGHGKATDSAAVTAIQQEVDQYLGLAPATAEADSALAAELEHFFGVADELTTAADSSNLRLHAVTRSSWVDYAAWIVDRIVMPRFTRKERVTTSTWVPLPKNYILTAVPVNIYKYVMSDLLNAKVIECDMKFRKGTDGRPGKCYY